MKVVINCKCPDGVSCARDGLTVAQNDELDESGIVRKFFKYGEYVRIELDTETMTARVLEA